MVRGMTDIILAPECNDSDRTWVSLMLQAAEIPAKVFKACGCGYGEECGMHCHHGTMLKDPCPGDDFWKTNGIEQKLVVKTKPQSPDLQQWNYNPTLDAITIEKEEAERWKRKFEEVSRKPIVLSSQEPKITHI